MSRTGPVSRTGLVWTIITIAEGVALTILLRLGVGTSASAEDRWTLMAVLLAWGAIGWLTLVLRPRLSPVTVGLVLPPVVATALAAVLSRYVSLGLHATLTTACLAGIGLMLWSQLADAVARPRLLAMLTAIAGLVAILYLLDVAVVWAGWAGLGMSLVPPPLRPGIIGGLLPISHGAADAVVVAAPIAVAFLWPRGRRARAGAVELAVISGATLLITATRAVWLGAAIPAMVWLFFWARSRPRLRIVMIPATVAAIAGFIVLQGRALDEGRISALRSALDELAANPVAGIGPGAYGIGRLDDPADALQSLVLPNAHNSPLNVGAELGILGLLAWVVTLAGVVYLARGTWRAGLDRGLVVGALFGLTAIGFHALVDLVFEIAGLAVLTLIAVGLTIVRPVVGSPRSESRASRSIAAAGLALTLAVGLASIPAEVSVATIRDLEADPGAPNALARVQAAADATPDFAPILAMEVRVAEQHGRLDLAAEAAGRLAALEPLAQHEIVAAWLSPDARDPERLLELARRQPTDPFVVLNVLAMLGPELEPSTATSLATALLVALPGFEVATGPQPPALSAALPAARQAAIDALLDADRFGEAALVAGASGDGGLISSTAERLAAAPGGDAAIAGLGLAAWLGDVDAGGQVTAMAGSADSEAIGWAWLVAARRCDTEAVNRWRLVTRILFGDQPRVPVRVGQAKDLDVSDYPLRYPEWIWEVELPQRPYPSMVWTFETGRPPCGR